MLVFYYYFLDWWYGSGVTPVMLELVPTYKEQLADYYGFSILLNLINLAVWSAFYCLYGGVYLFNNRKKISQITELCCAIDIISLHNYSSSFQWLQKYYRENNSLYNNTFYLYDTKPWEDNKYFHHPMLL